MQYLLLTRPQEDSEQLALRIQEKGYVPIIAPLLTPIYLESPIVVPDHLQSLLVTSKQALKSLEISPQLSFFQKIELICVGEKTGDIAKKMGFQNVSIAGENVEQMLGWIKNNKTSKSESFLYLHGDVVTKDIRFSLAETGFHVLTQQLYKMEEAQIFPPETFELMQGNVFYGITFFSPRTARIFVNMALKFKLEDYFSKTYALCLSREIAAEINIFPWKEIKVAKSPTQDALMELL